jgi:serine/threonine protein kinase
MIKFYGAVIEKNLCMVMELCERGSLHDVLIKNTELKLNWENCLDFSRDIAEGISVLHTHDPPIIHRDLKSLNLLVCVFFGSRFHLKLIPFQWFYF